MHDGDVQSDVMLDDVAPDVGITSSISAVDSVKLDGLPSNLSHRFFIDKEDEPIAARSPPCLLVAGSWMMHGVVAMHCRRPA